MHIGFESADFDALTPVWQRFFPAKYHIDAAMFRQKTIECPTFDWGASVIHKLGEAVLGFAVIKKSPSPMLYRGFDPDQTHLSAIAFLEPEVGVDMLAWAKSVIRDRGSYKLVYGQDSNHFFPGCPTECTQLRDFLTVEGFVEGGDLVDLEHDLGEYVPKAGTMERLAPGTGVEVRAIQPGERAALTKFLNKEFPGRWTYDVLDKIRVEGRTDMVYGLFVDGAVEGFAFTQDWTHKKPINGCGWKVDLGPNWGGLGPIGMAASMRGKGLGDSLLAGALTGLKEKGVRRCIIDWTGLVKYYGGHGFQVARRYNTFELKFDT